MAATVFHCTDAFDIFQHLTASVNSVRYRKWVNFLLLGG